MNVRFDEFMGSNDRFPCQRRATVNICHLEVLYSSVGEDRGYLAEVEAESYTIKYSCGVAHLASL